MTSARLRVVVAGPLVTYQDAGRPAQMRFGVPRSGPMDRVAAATANAALGNPLDATVIEVSRGGMVAECIEGVVTLGMAGGGFDVQVDGERCSPWCVVTVRAGQRVAIRSGAWGSWCAIAVAGALDAREWLGSTATHSMSGLGGGAIVAGDQLVVTDAAERRELDGEIAVPSWTRVESPIRVVLGPQDARFEDAAVDALTDSTFRLTDAFDRMGVRLDGPELAMRDALSIPSEPIVRGSIQVAGDGVATVLLADHQTTGGYPKIATVIGPDVDRFAQLRAGDEVRFTPITPAEAVEAARTAAVQLDAHLVAVARPDRTLSQRLGTQNLVGDVVPLD